MKKSIYLSFLLPLVLLASCSSDDDLADVNVNLTLDGVTVADNNFYTVEGNDVTVENLSVTSLTDKPATIVNARYFLNGVPLVPSFSQYETIGFSTTGLKPGSYNFEIAATVLQVDKSITAIASSYTINVVENEENLPEGAPEIGSYTLTLTTHQSK